MTFIARKSIRQVSLVFAIALFVLAGAGTLLLVAPAHKDTSLVEYPNTSTALANAIRTGGAGTYDITRLYRPPEDISVFCLSMSGVDPRKLAIDALGLPEGALQSTTTKLFVMEDVASTIVVFGDAFLIEPLETSLIEIENEPRNRCIREPKAIKLLVREEVSQRYHAKLKGHFEVHR